MTQFSEKDVEKLKRIISEGVQIYEETEVLKEALKDTVTATAEELNIKPATLNRAIRMAYKANFTKTQEEFDALEEILRATGRNY